MDKSYKLAGLGALATILIIFTLIVVFPKAEISQIGNTISEEPQGMTQKVYTDEVEERIHYHMNEARKREGKKTLEYDRKLADIARAHSKDMARNNYFSHENLRGQGATDRVKAAGYPTSKVLPDGRTRDYISENAAKNFLYRARWEDQGQVHYDGLKTADQLAQDITNSILASEHHKANIMDPEIDKEGIGVAITEDKYVYATQIFW